MVDTKTSDRGCLLYFRMKSQFFVCFLVHLQFLWPENQLDLALFPLLASQAQERPIIFFSFLLAEVPFVPVYFKNCDSNPKSQVRGLFGMAHAPQVRRTEKAINDLRVAVGTRPGALLRWGRREGEAPETSIAC